MEKIKQQFYNMSLKKSLLLILSVALFLIIILSSTTVLLTSSLQQMILDNRTIHIAVDTAIISEKILPAWRKSRPQTMSISIVNWLIKINLFILVRQ